MTPEERAVINGLRDRGYAICIFNPEELRGADPSRIEAWMCDRGWDAIYWTATEERQE